VIFEDVQGNPIAPIADFEESTGREVIQEDRKTGHITEKGHGTSSVEAGLAGSPMAKELPLHSFKNKNKARDGKPRTAPATPAKRANRRQNKSAGYHPAAESPNHLKNTSVFIVPLQSLKKMRTPTAKLNLPEHKISLSKAFSKAAVAGFGTGFLIKNDDCPATARAKTPREVEKEEEAEAAGNYIQENYKWVIPTVCTAFFITKTFQPILLQWNATDAGRYPFAVTSSIWMSRIILTLFFGVLLLIEEDSISRVEWRASIPFIGVAVCTIGNVLAIYLTVEFLGAGPYAVLKNLNLVLTAILIYAWLKRPVTPAQWSSVAIITLATFIFRISVFSGQDANVGYIFVLMGVLFSTLEGILLQIVTAQLPDMSFQKQSFFYHFYSLVLSSILMIAYDYDTVFYEPAGPFHGWNYKVVVYLICVVPLVSLKHAVAGLASAIMVKLLVAGTTVSTFVFAIVIFGNKSPLTTWLAAIIICIALVAYQMEGQRLSADLAFKLTFVNGTERADDRGYFEKNGSPSSDVVSPSTPDYPKGTSWTQRLKKIEYRLMKAKRAPRGDDARVIMCGVCEQDVVSPKVFECLCSFFDSWTTIIPSIFPVSFAARRSNAMDRREPKRL